MTTTKIQLISYITDNKTVNCPTDYTQINTVAHVVIATELESSQFQVRFLDLSAKLCSIEASEIYDSSQLRIHRTDLSHAPRTI